VDPLEELKQDLTGDLRVALGAHDGKEAERRHRELAMLIHRTARLVYANSHGDQAAWVDYLERWWPNMTAERARTLWTEWRKHLLKDGHPGTYVICHGQPRRHWNPQPPGNRIALNLESLWDDYEQSVDNLITECRRDTELQFRVLMTYDQRKLRVWTPAPYGAGPYPLASPQISGANTTVGGTIPASHLPIEHGDSISMTYDSETPAPTDP
jgi:hypothetical protein